MFNGKMFHYVGTYSRSDARKMAEKSRDPGKIFVRIIKVAHGWAVYARMK